MALTHEQKIKINNLIYERAYEIEAKLSEDNFLLAKLIGVSRDQVSDIALKVAIKELKNKMKNND